MSDRSIVVLFDQMKEAVLLARSYIDGLNKEDFLKDKRTQQATVMNLIIIGEISSRVLNDHSAFSKSYPQIPWKEMKGLRNRIAHGYFKLDLNSVWETLHISLPELAAAMVEVESSPEFRSMRISDDSQPDARNT